MWLFSSQKQIIRTQIVDLVSSQKSIKLPPISADVIKSVDVPDVLQNAPSKFFTNTTKAIVWGMQSRAVQSMLDFDFICRYKVYLDVEAENFYLCFIIDEKSHQLLPWYILSQEIIN